MKIAHYSEIETKSHEGNGAHRVVGRVLIGKADGAPNFAMRLFELGVDGTTPRHSHDWEHEAFIHAGQGAVWCDGTWTDVEVGSAVFVPANAEHQFRNTGKEPLQFVCVIPKGPPEI